MGDLAYNRAQTRVRIALQQRLTTTDTPSEREAVYTAVLDRLLRIAIDEAELTRVAHELAVEPAAIEWPDDRQAQRSQPSNRDPITPDE